MSSTEPVKESETKNAPDTQVADDAIESVQEKSENEIKEPKQEQEQELKRKSEQSDKKEKKRRRRQYDDVPEDEGEEEEEDEEDDAKLDAKLEEDDDNEEDDLAEIDSSNIITTGRRTRGKVIDYVKAAEKLDAESGKTEEEEEDNDDDTEFKEPTTATK